MITSFEKRGFKQGRIEITKKYSLVVLKAYFGKVPSAVRNKILKLNNLSKLNKIFSQCLTIKSIDELKF